MSDYYSYKKENFSCKYCGWKGKGSEVKSGEMFTDGFEINCPKCHEHFPGLILFPTHEESMANGTDAEKAFANKTNAFRKKWLASLLIDINQLPELHHDFMAFVLREIEEDDENYIVITQRGIIVWKEILAYEYYERFIEIGKLLKQKYGDAMIDLVPDTASDYLYGDSNSAIDLVLNFRKELRRNSQSK